MKKLKLNSLLKYNPIVIQCHNFPDADSLASGLALKKYFESKEKEVFLFYSGPRISKPNLILMTKLLGIELCEHTDVKSIEELVSLNRQNKELAVSDDHLLITVDCQYGMGNVSSLSAKNIATIDHHIQESKLPPIFDLRPYLGSCSTLVWDLLKKENFEIDKNLATALLYGLFMDTNSFSEVNHPLDKDMLEDLNFINEEVFKTLKLSNFSMEDFNQTAAALTTIQTINKDLAAALITAPPCDPNILGVVGDLALQIDEIKTVISTTLTRSNDTKLSIRTSTKDMNAADLMQWLTKDIGSGGGHKEKAGGNIADAKYKELYKNKSLIDYFSESLEKYYSSFKVIDCINPTPLTEFPHLIPTEQYRKLPVEQGVMLACEYYPINSNISVRTLEGDLQITIKENTYLMIGVTNEVYPITREVFEKKYELFDESYQPEVSYPPTAIHVQTGERINLLNYTKKCKSIGTSVVKAKQLENNQYIKLFTAWDTERYYTGKPQDWFVQIGENDLYIVTKSIFEKIYVRDFTNENIKENKRTILVQKKPESVYATIATASGILNTLEGEVYYSENDYILTGKYGDKWPVTQEYFLKNYKPSTEKNLTETSTQNLYTPISTDVYALQINEDFTLSLPVDKGTLYGKKGDWLIQYSEENYGIVRDSIFKSKYNML